MTDGTAEYNADHYRVNAFYDLAKAAVTRLAFAQSQDLAPHAATAVALTPGWMRSEAMLDAFGVTEETWRDAVDLAPHFAISETPRFVGRAVAAQAADPDRNRYTGRSLSSGGLAQVYGFTDLDGSRPDCWRYWVEVQDAGKDPVLPTPRELGAVPWTGPRQQERAASSPDRPLPGPSYQIGSDPGILS